MTVHHRLERNAGAPGVTVTLAEQFRQLGHETTIVSFDDLRLGRTEVTRALLFPYLVAWRAKRSGAWDVLDASTGDAWLYASLARGHDRPLMVCRSHGLEHTAHQRLLQQVRRGTERVSWKYPFYHGGWRLWEVGRSLHGADLVFVLNTDDRAFGIETLRLPAHRIRIVRNGVPQSFLGRTVKTPPSNAGQALKIAQVGRYAPMKGVAYGSKALNRVLRRHRHVLVHFLGTSVPAEAVLRDFDPEVRAQVSVTPHFAHEKLPELLMGHQIKLFPTLSEGFSLALVESMACGLTPVTTTAPGPGMIVADGENGLLVPPADAPALEAALERLIVDPELLLRLRKKALADAQAYSWRTIALEQLALYEEFRQARHKDRGP